MLQQIQTYKNMEVEKLEASDEFIDLTEIYDCEVFATKAVIALIHRCSTQGSERDKLLWEIVYMSAMNRSPLENTLCTFRAQIGGSWEAFYAEKTKGVVVISRA